MLRIVTEESHEDQLMASVSEPTAKLFSLRSHQATNIEHDVIAGQGSDVTDGEVVEIYKEESDGNRQPKFSLRNVILETPEIPYEMTSYMVTFCSHILLKITISEDHMKVKDTISISDTICNNKHFNFKSFKKVYMKKVKPEPVDLVVLTCKDTYLSRSDMWRMKKHLENTCVYVDKRLTYIGIKMQISVSEIWSKGETLTCGYISENTRICFRSSSAVLHIFIQMSAEMWEYDSYGDLYFEKAVSGFLTDLFDKWKNDECCHDVTIVMFSRTFYEASKIEEFPEYMRNGIQKDGEGRFYEDFYRVVIKNERYELWKDTIMKMKRLFINYKDKVLRNEERAANPSLPKATNSSAAQGNYLEVLNMSLNVFEKYFLDRNFDRLGKTAMVITPGPGVFEVDRDMMTVTKHRTIDSGSAADLICMGEQPLHTVPLFKVKDRGSRGEVHKIPKNWINHSFYTSQSQIRVTSTAQFIPRIKVASKKSDQELVEESANRIRIFPDISEVTEDANGDVDYDNYDLSVFKSSARRSRTMTAKKTRGEYVSTRVPRVRNLSDDTSDRADTSTANLDTRRQSVGTTLPADKYEQGSADREMFSQDASRLDDDEQSLPTGSAERYDSTYTATTPIHSHKYVDPFNPNSVNKPLSANQRRWVHTFPIDRNGVEIQPHHIYVDEPRIPISSQRLLSSGSVRLKDWSLSSSMFAKRVPSELRVGKHVSVTSFDGAIRESTASFDESYATSPHSYKIGSAPDSAFGRSDSQLDRLFVRGTEGDNTEFSPMTKTGVDWRSLTTPALLPISTDYYPDEQHFDKHYTDQVYSLDPLFESPLTPSEFFKELVSTRLALGFQVILSNKTESKDQEGSSTKSGTLKRSRRSQKKEEYRLSIGKMFHQLTLEDNSEIRVKVQQPRKVLKVREIEYKYLFMNPDSDDYTVSITKFLTEQLEYYKWNLLDNYVITRGFKSDENREIITTNESMKYWRSRYCLLPRNNNPVVKRMKEHMDKTGSVPPCDTFTTISDEDHSRYNDNFIKFLEVINCITKRKALQINRTSSKKATKSRSQDENRPTTPINLSSASVSSISNDDKTAADLTKSDIKALLDNMKDPSNGVTLLDTKNGLPNGTFVSYEAINWIRYNCVHARSYIEAVAILQRLLDEKHIEHITHNHDQFMCGFYLYCISSIQSVVPATQRDPAGEFDFDNEYVEVSLVVPPIEPSSPTSRPVTPTPTLQMSGPPSLQRQTSTPSTTSSALLRQMSSTPTPTAARTLTIPPLTTPPNTDKSGYRSSDIDTHINQKVKDELRRIEWTSLKYQCYYHPCCGFDLELDWIVATGGLLFEMINTWRRRVNNLDFHLMPIPIDPFALPIANNSDPLRGPIFIPLSTEIIERAGSNDELVDFLSYLIKQVGFIPIVYDYKGISDPSHTQFIHSTGGFFILIQTPGSSSNVTPEKAGFHWSWNFMMTKQWWGQCSGDENFQDMMLEDFRKLAANKEGRLSKHWEEWNLSAK